VKRVSICVVVGLLLALFQSPPARAQVDEVWPELDIYKKLSTNTRLFFIVSGTREGGASTKVEIGPNFDFFLKPLLKLKRFAGIQLDEAKSRPLLLRVGYRYLYSPEGTSENRGIVEATGRFPLTRGAVVSDRSRMDLRFVDGDFSWRYRNRLALERSFRLRNLTINPYGRVEASYNSTYGKWSGTTFDVGATIPFKKHWEIEAYIQHQNDTGKAPNQHINGVGVALSMYY
jgi:uncharacterized protein DUF2490